MGIFDPRLGRYLEQLAKGNKLFFQEVDTIDGFGYRMPVNLRNGQYETLSNDKMPLLNTNYIFWLDGNNGKLYCETCTFIGNSPDKFDESFIHDGNMALYFLFCISEKPIAEIMKKTDTASRYIDEKAMALGLKYLVFLLKKVNDTVPCRIEDIVYMEDVENMLSNIKVSYESFQKENVNDSLDMETIINELKQLASYRCNDIRNYLGFRIEYIRPSRADLETTKKWN